MGDLQSLPRSSEKMLESFLVARLIALGVLVAFARVAVVNESFPDSLGGSTGTQM